MYSGRVRSSSCSTSDNRRVTPAIVDRGADCLSSEYAMTLGSMLTYRSYTLCCQYVISQVPLVVFLV
jgi:hypothetical protein